MIRCVCGAVRMTEHNPKGAAKIVSLIAQDLRRRECWTRCGVELRHALSAHDRDAANKLASVRHAAGAADPSVPAEPSAPVVVAGR